jgi:hypothetical protein
MGLFFGQALTVSAGGNTFTRKEVAGSSWPGIAKMVYQCHPNHAGYFPDPDAEARPSRFMHEWFNLAVFVDEADAPVLYTSGRNYDRSAQACITFPDRRWLRFPVPDGWRGTAIMTAVDQAGDEVARYRYHRITGGRTEIIVHPGHPLTDELVLAIAISADWLGSYFMPRRDP